MLYLLRYAEVLRGCTIGLWASKKIRAKKRCKDKIKHSCRRKSCYYKTRLAWARLRRLCIAMRQALFSVGCRQQCDALWWPSEVKPAVKSRLHCQAWANDCLAAQQTIKLHMCLTATKRWIPSQSRPLIGDQTAALPSNRVQFTCFKMLRKPGQSHDFLPSAL